MSEYPYGHKPLVVLTTDINFEITWNCNNCGNTAFLNPSELPPAIYGGTILCKQCNHVSRIDNFPVELLKLAPRGKKYRKHIWFEKRKAKGLCTRCGKERDDKTKRACGVCREKYRIYSQKRKLAKHGNQNRTNA